jgi:hypothetical protein
MPSIRRVYMRIFYNIIYNNALPFEYQSVTEQCSPLDQESCSDRTVQIVDKLDQSKTKRNIFP